MHIEGELDLLTAPSLLSELTGLARAGYCHVDLYLRDVTFCDGTGLTALLKGQREFARRGGRVLVHDPCWSLRTLLDIFELTLALEPRVRQDSTDAAHPQD
ncbi:STAS domain-containing protein [Jannaschia sp. R86511]|uniref:STAS domain-containing protein n=1 Tax=Jannaschia sp. R86511 TaxID=3093853 RepID=UPI0036D41F5E